MSKEQKKKDIIGLLLEFKRMATSSLANFLHIPTPPTRFYLKEMEKEGLVMKDEETRATYWSLTKKGRDMAIEIKQSI